MKSLSKVPLRIIAITLIVVVGMHSLNSFFYTHSHQMEDGTIITHAHPFDTSSDTDPFKSHEHTVIELVFLANLVHFLPTITFAAVGLIIVYRQRAGLFLQILSHQYAVGIPSLRGPPTPSLWVY